MKPKILEVLGVQLINTANSDDQLGIAIEATYLVEIEDCIDIITWQYTSTKAFLNDINSRFINNI